MPFFNSLIRVVLAAALVVPMAPLQARTKKGDKYLAEGRVYEDKKEWDAALESYVKALSEDPGELVYQMASQKAHFQAGQSHVDRGLKIRSSGQLGEALLEFQKAYAIDPSSSVAVQELQRTQDMIQRERKRVMETGKEAPPEQRGLTPIEEMKKQTEEKTKRILGVPELKPLDPAIRNISFSGQKVQTLFETLGKMATINVLWDPDFAPPTKNSFTVHFDNETFESALDQLAVMTLRGTGGPDVLSHQRHPAAGDSGNRQCRAVCVGTAARGRVQLTERHYRARRGRPGRARRQNDPRSGQTQA
jgi:general secretion pathway protein D